MNRTALEKKKLNVELWKLYHLPTVPHYGGGTKDGYTIYDRDGSKKGRKFS